MIHSKDLSVQGYNLGLVSTVLQSSKACPWLYPWLWLTLELSVVPMAE